MAAISYSCFAYFWAKRDPEAFHHVSWKLTCPWKTSIVLNVVYGVNHDSFVWFLDMELV